MSEPRPVTRAHVIACARAWIGTPYHHQASARGFGTDCLGLVRGVWRELYGEDAERPPAYSRDWAEARGDEPLLAAAARHLRPVPTTDRAGGDVVIFRYRAHWPAKHVGILTNVDQFVHAVEGAPVAEIDLAPWWQRRIAGVFAFPEVRD
ncbi:MAG: NlpC/P60 family protein [Pseudomonadota bacterium]